MQSMKIKSKNQFFFLVAGLVLTASSQAKAEFGAIAIDDGTFAYGYRLNSPTEADANAGALGWCANGGSTHCHVLFTFTARSCGTLAVSQNGRYWYSNSGEGNHAQTVAYTRAQSVAQCRDAGGERCAPQASICSDMDTNWTSPSQGAVSNAVVQYAASQMGQQVGNGQCWTLVDAALAASGAVRPEQWNFDTYVFGEEVYRDFRPGDILQFEDVRFETPNRQDEFPHHTAIVAAANGSVVTLYQQNVNGDMRVQTGVIDLNTKVRGRIRGYRPIPLN